MSHESCKRGRGFVLEEEAETLEGNPFAGISTSDEAAEEKTGGKRGGEERLETELRRDRVRRMPLRTAASGPTGVGVAGAGAVGAVAITDGVFSRRMTKAMLPFSSQSSPWKLLSKIGLQVVVVPEAVRLENVGGRPKLDRPRNVPFCSAAGAAAVDDEASSLPSPILLFPSNNDNRSALPLQLLPSCPPSVETTFLGVLTTLGPRIFPFMTNTSFPVPDTRKT